MAEYENEDIPMIHLTVDESPWDPSTNEYSEKETCTIDHQSQISSPATAARGAVYFSTVMSHYLAYDAANVMDNDDHMIALSAQI